MPIGEEYKITIEHITAGRILAQSRRITSTTVDRSVLPRRKVLLMEAETLINEFEDAGK